jgi:hypothetical protein
MATSNTEIRDSIAIIVALAFGFAYKFSGPATLSNWSANFILILILVAISILIHDFVHKIVARKFLADVKSQIWLSGIVVMLILLVITNGWLVFAAIWAVSIIPLRLMRPGRTWQHIGPRERSIIAVSGPLSNLALAVVAKALVPVFGTIAIKLMTINLAIALFNLVPFFTLLPVIALQWTKEKALEAPYVEGEFVFFGSRTLWVFIFAFTLILATSLLFLGAVASVLLALFLAFLLFVAWHYYFESEMLPGMEMKGPSFRKYR